MDFFSEVWEAVEPRPASVPALARRLGSRLVHGPRRGIRRFDTVPEIRDRVAESFLELNPRLPTELAPRDGDVGAPHLRIILGQRQVVDRGAAVGQLDHALCKLEDREL